MNDNKKFVIIGAGVSGLAFAYECLLRGHDVTLIEKDSRIGGLSKSITYNDCQLDIGVHILHGRDSEVLGKVREVVTPEKWVKVKRNGKLYLKGKYISWPFKFSAIYELPFLLGLKITYEQIFNKKTQVVGLNNFQDELLQIYGPTLYYSFFYPLTRKFLKTDPGLIHSDWAFSSLRAATKIEDESFTESYKYLTNETDSKKEFNAIRFILKSITANRDEEPFYYFKNGFGTLVESYKEKILDLGGRIETSLTVDWFVINQDQINACVVDGKEYDCNNVVWTGNLVDLYGLLDIEDPQLSYIHSRYIFVFLENCNKDHQVCYYADEDVSFSRGTILSNHSKSIINNVKVSDIICLEYSYRSIEELRAGSAGTTDIALRDLIKVGIINSTSEIYDTYEIKVPYTYPVLSMDYKEKLSCVQEKINKYKNLITIGRQATFSYDNVDVVIKDVLNHQMFRKQTD
jgi:protoporphyrinogen oxidase|tara:strand:- start:2066 stop:3445 length:1380 start_codon:yes stop_codon:yes gene_type:complete